MPKMDMNRINAEGVNKFATLLGIEFTDCADGVCTAVLKVRDHHHHSGGVAQGGVAFSLADATMAHALMSALDANEACSTIEMKISYLEAVREGTMDCKGVIVRRGKRVAFMESKVHNGDRLVATATASFAIMPIAE